MTDDELKLRNCMLFLDDEEKIRFLKSLYYIHVAFDDDLQVVYLKISDAIFSYSLETRQLAKVMCSDPSFSFDLHEFDNYSLIFKAYQFRQ